jgi:cupin fold WbuC family metalloprotein
MIIVHKKDHFYRPHKHLLKGEAYHMIEGELMVFIFDDKGQVVESTHIGASGLNLPFIYRIGKNLWHCTVPITERVVFHEMKPGPFQPEGDSIYPDWAPDGKDLEMASKYRQSLLNAT